jgi:HAD superfamily hydrolase (TIGR01490 family)
MSSSPNVAAIFDLDGTLLNGHVWSAVARYQKTHRVNRRWLYIYVVAHMPLWYLFKLRLMRAEQMRALWTRDMSWVLRGFDDSQAVAMFRWITDEYVVPLLRPDVVERLREHQGQGHRVILLSGAFEGLLAVIGQRFGVTEVLGTRLAQQNGHYVGRALPPVCQGEGKAQRLRAYLETPGREIDLVASYVYADSLTDLPLLEAVGHAVAVYPEEELTTVARQRAWSILGTTS